MIREMEKLDYESEVSTWECPWCGQKLSAKSKKYFELSLLVSAYRHLTYIHRYDGLSIEKVMQKLEPILASAVRKVL